jgi:hypothetical protein
MKLSKVVLETGDGFVKPSLQPQAFGYKVHQSLRNQTSRSHFKYAPLWLDGTITD